MAFSEDPTKWSTTYLLAAHSASFENEEDIKQSDRCGCFYCKSVFNSSEINSDDWCDDKNARTALCPYCGIDAVIGDASNFPVCKDFVHAMHLVWFENSRNDEKFA